MNKLYLIAVSLSMNLFYFGQSTIIFEEKSVQISNNVEIQALKLYSEINNGNELTLNVLTKKENKKLSNQDKINYSKVRVKKLAAFYKDSIGIEAQNLLIQFKPFLNKRQSSNGHPVCCAAALASLELISDKKLLSKVEIKGRLFEDLLTHPLIKEIRRKGMFFAIELENEDVVQQVVQGCKENGVLTFWFLSNPQSFRIAPPLTITENEIKIACEVIIQVMDAI